MVRLSRIVLALCVLAAVPKVSVFAQDVSSELYSGAPGGLSPQLQRVRTLVRANALDLALAVLESQSPPAVATDDWIAWERQLWALYKSQSDWEALQHRASQVPPGFPLQFRQEAALQSAQASINLGKGADARKILRSLLVSPGLGDVEKRQLRRQIVESYLAGEHLQDAAASMGRYQSDFRSQDTEWLILSAQVHIQLGDYSAAINLLAPVDSNRARLLLIYARLQDQSMTPEQAAGRLQDLTNAVENGSGEVTEQQIWSLLVYSSLRIPDYLRAQSNLEKLVGQPDTRVSALDRSFPVYSRENLLQIYTHIAREAGNTAGILVGEHAPMFDFAVQLSSDQIGVKKAIYGHLLQVLDDPVFRLQVSNFYVEALLQTGSIEILPILFGKDAPLGEMRLSGNVGLKLSNAALEQGLVELAAMANENLTEIPDGMAEDQWKLHIARVSIFAGHYDQGADELSEWLRGKPELPPEAADQVLQPVFDLQTVGQHRLALDLLLEIHEKVRSPRHLREISFWIAESYQANRQYISAAEHYLFSALLKDNGLDQWGEAARFRAAESLKSANLVTDSRALFEGILARSNDENRRLQIQQQLQELILLESSLLAN